jgi:3-hydroxy-9,10-secoandrosta-1,3,5(10)-triene-9,17-dione monooxygenase
MELPFVAVVDLAAEIARGCPSTAWNVGNLGIHHWLLAFYDPETQHEVWDANPDALIASSIALAAGRARRAETACRNGRCPCQWTTRVEHARRRPGRRRRAPIDRLCLRQGRVRSSTPGGAGHVGTAADVAVRELFVPERRAPPHAPRGLEDPGPRSTGPLYRIPVVAASAHPLGAAAIGAAQGALDLFVDTMSRRTGTYTGARVSDFQAVQVKVARARCLVDSARELMRQSAIEFQRLAERNEVPDLETKLRFRAHAAFAVNQAREAVETLWSCYGANGIYARDPLQRHLRDVLAMNQHFSFNFDIAGPFAHAGPGGTYAN